jgi:hypothetical protein
MSRSRPTHYIWLLVLIIPTAAVFILLQESAFRFVHKTYLWGLCAIAPAIFLFAAFHLWREKHLERFASPKLIDQLIPESAFDKHLLKFILLSLAFELDLQARRLVRNRKG